MQGQGLRDQASRFAELDCLIFGASFDTPDENRAFREKYDFPFSLLCDTDHSVGERYEVVRAPDDQYAAWPMRISYLIDPEGVIRRAYEVVDRAGHAAEVVDDLLTLVDS